MGSHSVTCHLAQVNVPRLGLSQIGRYSIYLSRRDGRLSFKYLISAVELLSRTVSCSSSSVMMCESKSEIILTCNVMFVVFRCVQATCCF